MCVAVAVAGVGFAVVNYLCFSVDLRFQKYPLPASTACALKSLCKALRPSGRRPLPRSPSGLLGEAAAPTRRGCPLSRTLTKWKSSTSSPPRPPSGREGGATSSELSCTLAGSKRRTPCRRVLEPSPHNRSPTWRTPIRFLLRARRRDEEDDALDGRFIGRVRKPGRQKAGQWLAAAAAIGVIIESHSSRCATGYSQITFALNI